MLQTSQVKQRSGLCLSPPGRGQSAMQLPRCRGRWAPLPWQASHSGSHTPAQLTAIYLSLPRQKPPSVPGAVGCGGHESQNTGEGDGAPWDESSNQVSMRQTHWPGFKANFCNRGRLRRAQHSKRCLGTVQNSCCTGLWGDQFLLLDLQQRAGNLSAEPTAVHSLVPPLVPRL